jgi:hypothetical protein
MNFRRWLSLLDPKWYVAAGIKWNVFDGNQSRLKRKIDYWKPEVWRKIEDANEMIALSVIKAELTYESSLQNTEMIQKEIELQWHLSNDW